MPIPRNLEQYKVGLEQPLQIAWILAGDLGHRHTDVLSEPHHYYSVSPATEPTADVYFDQ